MSMTHATHPSLSPSPFHEEAEAQAESLGAGSKSPSELNLGQDLFYLILHLNELEKEMAIHSSTIAWKIPWTEAPGRLQSMGLQRVRHD